MKFTISHETPALKLGYGTIPAELRGNIITTGNWRKGGENNDGRKPTNKEYGKQNNISTRQASKKRRGY